MALVSGDDGVDGLDLGRPPRAPLSRRTRRLLAAGVAVVVVAVVAAVLLVRLGHDAPPATPVAIPALDPSAGFAAGPELVRVDDHDELTVPGGAMFGGAAMNVGLAPASDMVAVVRQVFPDLDDVHGGRVTDPAIHYGLFLSAVWTAPAGDQVELTVYTARSAGTPASTTSSVARRPLGDSTGDPSSVVTDGSVYTGHGWWVHGDLVAPDVTSERAGRAADLLRLLADPRLVS